MSQGFKILDESDPVLCIPPATGVCFDFCLPPWLSGAQEMQASVSAPPVSPGSRSGSLLGRELRDAVLGRPLQQRLLSLVSSSWAE